MTDADDALVSEKDKRQQENYLHKEASCSTRDSETNYELDAERGANLNFEPEFRKYVLETLEPEMQSDISKAEKQGDETQLCESEQEIFKERSIRHQSNRPSLFEKRDNLPAT